MNDRIINNIPQLELSSNVNSLSGSWVVSRKASGEVIGEFFEPASLIRLSTEKVIIETALQYLGRINRRIKENGK